MHLLAISRGHIFNDNKRTALFITPAFFKAKWNYIASESRLRRHDRRGSSRATYPWNRFSPFAWMTVNPQTWRRRRFVAPGEALAALTPEPTARILSSLSSHFISSFHRLVISLTCYYPFCTKSNFRNSEHVMLPREHKTREIGHPAQQERVID